MINKFPISVQVSNVLMAVGDLNLRKLRKTLLRNVIVAEKTHQSEI